MKNIKNFLNLKKKDPSDIVYVEKIVLKDRSLFFEISRMLMIIAIASGIVWGISNADNLVKPLETNIAPNKNFSAIGIVTEVATTTVTIGDAKSSDQSGNTTYTFDTTNVSKIETANYSQLTLADILVGDKIIVQGIFDDTNNIQIKRIISFGGGTTTPVVATSTDATSTEATSTATSTVDLNASSTDATTTDATSTATTTATSTGVVDSVISSVQGAVQTIINVVTGSSTATDTSATTTDTSSTTTTSTTQTNSNANSTGQATSTPDVTAPANTDASSTQ